MRSPGCRQAAAIRKRQSDVRLAAPPDPWQRQLYDDWVARLGEERMQGFLRALCDQLRVLLLLASVGDRDAMHRLAHDVASTAGMLGFLEVTRCCRALREATTGTEDEAGAALGAALEAAIAGLERHFATRTGRAAA